MAGAEAAVGGGAPRVAAGSGRRVRIPAGTTARSRVTAGRLVPREHASGLDPRLLRVGEQVRVAHAATEIRGRDRHEVGGHTVMSERRGDDPDLAARALDRDPLLAAPQEGRQRRGDEGARPLAEELGLAADLGEEIGPGSRLEFPLSPIGDRRRDQRAETRGVVGEDLGDPVEKGVRGTLGPALEMRDEGVVGETEAAGQRLLRHVLRLPQVADLLAESDLGHPRSRV